MKFVKAVSRCRLLSRYLAGLFAMAIIPSIYSGNVRANHLPPPAASPTKPHSNTVPKPAAPALTRAPKPASPPVKASASPKGPQLVIKAIHEMLGIEVRTQAAARKKSPPESDAATAPRRHQSVLMAAAAKTQAEQALPATPKATPSSKPEKMSETDALKAFYGRKNRKPVWVSQTAARPVAHAVLAEFDQADAYGLRPQDFSLAQNDKALITGKRDELTPTQLARLELALSKTVLKYARFAKGGRIDPKKLSRFQDRGPAHPDYHKILTNLASSKKPEHVLRALHPQHPQFAALRKKLVELSARRDKTTPKKSAKPRFPVTGPTLRMGMKHAQIALLRKRLGIADEKQTEFDETVRADVVKFQRKTGLGADGIVGPGTRRALAGVGSARQSIEKQRARILINMERWRWMPQSLQGNNNIYVWANVPELRVRIIRKEKVIFAERVIAGKPGKQSPMFSDKMEWIEFNPTWFIPNSIKVADILPSLRGKGRVVSRYHLRIDCGKFGKDFTKIDWKKVDIRKCAVTQPTGAKSVLGKIKFKFPNKHAVYMHDTLTPGLFNRKHRILSHGCIRIRNPRRMAEVLLANDKGMSANRVGALLARRGLHTEHLKKSIPVHITYFSTRVTDEGSLTSFPDYYGHDKRLASALLGKGHLFKGAIYSGRKAYKRKKRRRVTASIPTVNPAYFPEN